jgi:hypothetical protein
MPRRSASGSGDEELVKILGAQEALQIVTAMPAGGQRDAAERSILAILSQLSIGDSTDNDTEMADVALMASAFRGLFSDVVVDAGVGPQFGQSWYRDLGATIAGFRNNLGFEIGDESWDADDWLRDVSEPQQRWLVTAALAEALESHQRRSGTVFDRRTMVRLLRVAFADPTTIWTALAGQARPLFDELDMFHATEDIATQAIQDAVATESATRARAVYSWIGEPDAIGRTIVDALVAPVVDVHRPRSAHFLARLSSALRLQLPEVVRSHDDLRGLLSQPPACDALRQAFSATSRSDDFLLGDAWCTLILRASSVVLTRQNYEREETFRWLFQQLSPNDARTLARLSGILRLDPPMTAASAELLQLAIARLAAAGLYRRAGADEVQLTPIGAEFVRWVFGTVDDAG